MKTKKFLYAAVGAPVVVAKNAQARVGEIRLKLGESTESLSKDLESQLEQWAAEGEVLLGRIGDSKAMDGLTERMDLEQVQDQVGKLREQIEDLLDTWRSNFRPGGERGDGSALPQPRSTAVPAAQTVASEPATGKPTAGTAGVTTPSHKAPSQKAAPKKPAAKKSPSQKSTAKKPASQKPASQKPTAGK